MGGRTLTLRSTSSGCPGGSPVAPLTGPWDRGPADKVAVLSGNDPVAFSCVFGISRAGAVWCPVNPRNEAAENRDLLDFFDCACLIFQAAFAPLVVKIRPDLPKLTTLVCLDGDVPGALTFEQWLDGLSPDPWQATPADDMVMLVGTGGTTGRSKGVMLSDAISLRRRRYAVSHRFRPAHPLPAPRAAVSLRPACCSPRRRSEEPQLSAFKPEEAMALIQNNKVNFSLFLPTMINMLVKDPALANYDLSLPMRCQFGGSPMPESLLRQAMKVLPSWQFIRQLRHDRVVSLCDGA